MLRRAHEDDGSSEEEVGGEVEDTIVVDGTANREHDDEDNDEGGSTGRKRRLNKVLRFPAELSLDSHGQSSLDTEFEVDFFLWLYLVLHRRERLVATLPPAFLLERRGRVPLRLARRCPPEQDTVVHIHSTGDRVGLGGGRLRFGNLHLNRLHRGRFDLFRRFGANEGRLTSQSTSTMGDN